MKKFLLLVFAALSITSCASKSSVKNLNNNNSTESNNPITPEQNDDKYTIRFLNDEGTEISSKQYEFGEMPEAPDTPSKENPLPQYTYTFSGWSPSIALVTEDVDYVATYEVDAKIGEVIWVDGDGETLLAENYAYGSMPNYHGDIPTKTPTDTESYVFKGWSPEISLVSKESTTYVAQFSPIYAKYSIQINCTDCLVNKKKHIDEEHNVLSDLTYQFNNTSKETYHYPYKLEVMVDGKVTNDYAYDNITGKLNIKLTGDTVINAIADNSCVLMKYKYSTSYPTVEIKCDGEFERVDWGDGTTYDATNKSHTYSDDPDVDQYDIRIFGKLNSIGTTSKAVTSVYIFHSVILIDYRAFYNCSSLNSITIPNSVTSIGTDAFYDCSSLTSITIPNSVTSIGFRAFCSYPSFLIIYCEAESKPSGWDFDWNFDNRPVVWGYIGNGEYNNLKYGISSIDGNKSIVIAGLVDETATTVEIPSAIKVNDENIPVTSIGNYAFYECSSLTSITIHNSVTSIGANAFYECSSLTSITIPNSVVSIGDYAFENCRSLTSITIPNSVTSIGAVVFYDCSSLIIYCEAESKPSGWASNWNFYDYPVVWGYIGNGEYNNLKYGVSSIGGNKSIVITGLVDKPVTTVTIPSAINIDGEDIPVTSIGSYAFYERFSLTSITIPNSVTSIGAHAFENCYFLTSITIPNSVTSISDSTFYKCIGLTSVIIPNSVTSIGTYAFYECRSLTSVIIPSSVVSIGDSAFSTNSSPLIIYCEAESKPSGWDSDWNFYDYPVVWGYIGNGEYNNLKYGVSSIGGNKSIVITGLVDKTVTTATIPSAINIDGEDIPVTSIGSYAFYECSSLTSITIPNSVTSISDSTFYRCIGLTSITIPNSVTSIGSRAFYECTSLTSITIPNSVTSIGSRAFCQCYSLGLLDLCDCDHVVSANYYFLYSTKDTLQIKVKASLVEDYKAAPYWSDYAENIVGV